MCRYASMNNGTTTNTLWTMEQDVLLLVAGEHHCLSPLHWKMIEKSYHVHWVLHNGNEWKMVDKWTQNKMLKRQMKMNNWKMIEKQARSENTYTVAHSLHDGRTLTILWPLLYIYVYVYIYILCACIHTAFQPPKWVWLRRMKRKSPAICFVSRYWFLVQSHNCANLP